MDCRIFNSYKGTGIAVLTCTFRIFITNSIDDVRLKRLAEVPGMLSQLMAKGLQVRDSLLGEESLCCVLEQDTLSTA